MQLNDNLTCMMNSYFSEKDMYRKRTRAKYIEDTYVLKIKDVTFVGCHYM